MIKHHTHLHRTQSKLASLKTSTNDPLYKYSYMLPELRSSNGPKNAWLSMWGIHRRHDLLGCGELKLFFYWLGNSNSGSRGARAIKTHAWGQWDSIISSREVKVWKFRACADALKVLTTGTFDIFRRQKAWNTCKEKKTPRVPVGTA